VRIKQLELAGFKSFLDKTKFEFNAPITTIVGPNGCGKSNVVDALKWISGELSYKELRGRSMEDLIFAGSDRRAPTSMMEVSLVLDNQEKTAPAQYNQYDEITLQRRIFRDGTSEFFINKVPCRLRDITDMFLDTGIGQSSYSIIEQG
jgi:chromosome segregation protein